MTTHDDPRANNAMTAQGSGYWSRGLSNAFYSALFTDPLLRGFYGDSGYANFGFWDHGARDATAACDALVDRILAPVPATARRVLDVACGTGATTRRVRERLPSADIVGIGVSTAQLDAARMREPGAEFVQMDATRLEFPAGSMDAVMCVEAAFHFDTRAQFLSQALHVLRPGGQLVMSDLLMARGTALVPPANYLGNRAAYVRLLEHIGFVDVEVADATAATWDGFRRHLTAYIARQGSPGALALRDLYAANVVCAWAVRQCVLVSARRAPSA